MATITVKNIPPDLYEQLKLYAAANRRSINSEIIVCIERVVRSQQIDPEATLARARQIRQSTIEFPISDADFNAAKLAGRP